MVTAAPAVVIAAPSSGSGKTTVATGLIGALRAAGHRVAPFKVGPDFIDPGYHALAAGRPGRNLDPVLVPEGLIAPLYRHGSRDADVAVIEGVMIVIAAAVIIVTAVDRLLHSAQLESLGIGLLISVVAAPCPFDYFKRHQKFLTEGQSVVLVMVAPHSYDAFKAFTARNSGEIVFDATTAGDLKGLPPVFELAWNHTTLRALRVDPAWTYLQVLYPFPNQLELASKMDRMFPGELISHLEFVRFDGDITCFGLPLIRFTTEERLEEIMDLHNENGCPIFNPHRYTLEEGGMKQTDEIQLAFKREADPKGLLNPGKMIAWDDPDYDFGTGKTWLFKGLKQAS